MNSESFRFTVDMIHDSGFIRALKAADVVLTEPTSPEWNPAIAFGARAYQRISKGGKRRKLLVLRLIVDWESEEPEALCAALLTIKGGCELFSESESNGSDICGAAEGGVE
jgi:hypothetical protein